MTNDHQSRIIMTLIALMFKIYIFWYFSIQGILAGNGLESVAFIKTGVEVSLWLPWLSYSINSSNQALNILCLLAFVPHNLIFITKIHIGLIIVLNDKLFHFPAVAKTYMYQWCHSLSHPINYIRKTVNVGIKSNQWRHLHSLSLTQR